MAAGDRIVELPTAQFNHVIQTVYKSQEKARQLGVSSAKHLKALNVATDPTKAVNIAQGEALHTNLKSIIDWIESIKSTDAAAVAQLVALQATAAVRSA